MPQYLTEEEMQKMQLIPMSKKGRSHPVRNVIKIMPPNTIIFVKREEFTWKGRTPKQFCNELSKSGKKKFSVFKLPDKSGWVVKRLK